MFRWYPDNAGDPAATAAGGQVRPLHQARGGAESLLDTGAGHMSVYNVLNSCVLWLKHLCFDWGDEFFQDILTRHRLIWPCSLFVGISESVMPYCETKTVVCVFNEYCPFDAYLLLERLFVVPTLLYSQKITQPLIWSNSVNTVPSTVLGKYRRGLNLNHIFKNKTDRF